MIELRFSSEDGRTRLWLSSKVVLDMAEASHRAYPHEACGVLVGRYFLPGLAVATDVLLAKARFSEDSVTRGQIVFVLDEGEAERLTVELRRLWEAKPRRHYLGDWHSHTRENCPHHSELDFQALLERYRENGRGVLSLVYVQEPFRASSVGTVWCQQSENELVQLFPAPSSKA